ncbi:hypothetical protein G6F23_013358 [Rhizopus arrhizus]|nr:hypothetical protein G6F23_013358 [Rhizopus arrhizus]
MKLMSGRRRTAAERQQHGQLDRRAVAIAQRRRALAGIELGRAIAIERARQRQAARDQRTAGEVVQRVVGRQRGGTAAQGGVVEGAEQAGDGRLVVAAGAAGQAGMGAGTFGGGTEGITGALQCLGACQQPAGAQADRNAVGMILQQCQRLRRLLVGQRQLGAGQLAQAASANALLRAPPRRVAARPS